MAGMDKFASPKFQSFSLPQNIIYYVMKHLKTPNEYQKMIQICKYFFALNPIIVAEGFNTRRNKCRIFNHPNNWFWGDIKSEATLSPEQFHQIPYKIWITKDLIIEKSINFQKIIFANLNFLWFHHARLSFNEILLFSGIKTHIIEFEEVEFRYDDGSVVPFENFFSIFSDNKIFRFKNNDTSYITSNTAKEIIKCKNFKTLETFTLQLIPEIFDYKIFFQAMKRHPGPLRLRFRFVDSISEEYWDKFQNSIYRAKRFPK